MHAQNAIASRLPTGIPERPHAHMHAQTGGHAGRERPPADRGHPHGVDAAERADDQGGGGEIGGVGGVSACVYVFVRVLVIDPRTLCVSVSAFMDAACLSACSASYTQLPTYTHTGARAVSRELTSRGW